MIFIIRWVLLLLTARTLVLSIPVDQMKPNCGYQSCNPTKSGFVNVHIVPHTHDDVGWLKTVDQYYYGSNNSIQLAGVQYIIDSVFDSLKRNPSRRFIYVETAFLWKWWIQQHDIIKSQFKKLINNGQLEIIGGAWSMNDEAVTHYQSIVDQFTWGMRKLNETFGACARPKIGWQIDPFGHSREMASIFAQLGFDGIFLGRIDYQDKRKKFNSSSAEMIWKSSSSLGNTSNIFTSVLYNTYSPPPGFCFDILCDDEPIVESKKSPLYNVDRKVKEFFAYLDKMRKVYRTDNLLVTMGNDFTYQQAETWYKNLDKLIKYGNLKQEEGSKYNLLYSTPSCYLKAVNEESKKKNLKWLVKSDDFFPYASDEHSYWTGYFTSRPTIKRFERLGNNFLQVCKQLYAMADLGPEDKSDLNSMREAMGIMQHHDAITGTEKQHVAKDYSRILYKGFEECEIATDAALKKLTKKTSNQMLTVSNNGCQFNISECSFTENEKTFLVTVYNPLSRAVDHYVRLPVLNGNFKVLDPQGNSVANEIIPIARPIFDIPGRKGNATHELLFLASDIPPLGFKSYFVSKTQKIKAKEDFDDHNATLTEKSNKDEIEIKSNTNNFSYNKDTGLLAGVNLNGQYIPLTQEFLYYRGTVGNNRNALNRSSGAYIFRPNETTAFRISPKASVETYVGNLVAEVRQKVSNWISQIIRIYNKENFIEFDWLVGPIPANDVNGKEIITRYTSKLKSESTFYTDSNGREILKRIRNFRPTWNLELYENVSANYYPVTSKISIRDESQNLEISVLTDRAQGGTSLQDGQIELMVHRDCLHDDAFGVGEALHEEAFSKGLVARGSHYLVSGSYTQSPGKTSLAEIQKDIAQRKLLSTWTFLTPTEDLSFEEYRNKYVLEFNGLKKALPRNVQILTLEPWIGTSFLLRLEHVYEVNEDNNLSVPVTIDLQDLFTTFDIISLRETTLGANQWLEENDRLHFESDSSSFEDFEDYDKGTSAWMLWNKNRLNSNELPEIINEGKLKIQLQPMQIRTFILTIKIKKI